MVQQPTDLQIWLKAVVKRSKNPINATKAIEKVGVILDKISLRILFGCCFTFFSFLFFSLLLPLL